MSQASRSTHVRARSQEMALPPVPSQEEPRQPLPDQRCDVGCPWCPRHGRTGCPSEAATTPTAAMERSGFLRGLGAAMGAAALGLGAAPLGGIVSPPASALAAGKPRPVAAGKGLWLGNAKGLTPGQALAYTDPGSGDPALLLRLADGRYVSYDAGCTHGTCTVAFDNRRRLLVCPCHGATFDPARGAAVVVGPARDPLYALPIRVDVSGDVFYLAAPPGPRVNRLHPAPPYTGQTGDDGAEDE